MCQILFQVLGYSSQLHTQKFPALRELRLSLTICLLSQLSLNYDLLKYYVTTELLFL